MKVAGLVLVHQRPGTAGGVCFITIEDENGYSNLVVFETLFETYRNETLHSRILMVEGRLQREGKVVHLIVSKCFDFTKMLGKLVQREVDDLPVLTLARRDEKMHPILLRTNGRRLGKRCRRKLFTVEGILSSANNKSGVALDGLYVLSWQIPILALLMIGTYDIPRNQRFFYFY